MIDLSKFPAEGIAAPDVAHKPDYEGLAACFYYFYRAARNPFRYRGRVERETFVYFLIGSILTVLITIPWVASAAFICLWFYRLDYLLYLVGFYVLLGFWIYLAFLSMKARRLRDLNLSSWWVLLPIGVALGWLFFPLPGWSVWFTFVMFFPILLFIEGRGEYERKHHVARFQVDARGRVHDKDDIDWQDAEVQPKRKKTKKKK